MKKITRKNIELGVLFGLICAIVLSFSHFEAIVHFYIIYK